MNNQPSEASQTYMKALAKVINEAPCELREHDLFLQALGVIMLRALKAGAPEEHLKEIFESVLAHAKQILAKERN